jgi:hypothetical protein
MKSILDANQKSLLGNCALDVILEIGFEKASRSLNPVSRIAEFERLNTAHDFGVSFAPEEVQGSNETEVYSSRVKLFRNNSSPGHCCYCEEGVKHFSVHEAQVEWSVTASVTVMYGDECEREAFEHDFELEQIKGTLEHCKIQLGIMCGKTGKRSSIWYRAAIAIGVIELDGDKKYEKAEKTFDEILKAFKKEVDELLYTQCVLTPAEVKLRCGKSDECKELLSKDDVSFVLFCWDGSVDGKFPCGNALHHCLSLYFCFLNQLSRCLLVMRERSKALQIDDGRAGFLSVIEQALLQLLRFEQPPRRGLNILTVRLLI